MRKNNREQRGECMRELFGERLCWCVGMKQNICSCIQVDASKLHWLNVLRHHIMLETQRSQSRGRDL